MTRDSIFMVDVKKGEVMRRFSFYMLFLSLSSLCAGDLGHFLDGYKKASDFSKMTTKDSAGLVEVFTRDDLEQMQVHNLLDILKIVPGIYLSRSATNSPALLTPSVARISTTYTRLYINDHDISSSSFGSAFLVWGELPLEYIDHIEVYKATSSIEFGNENAAFIIRLYTKNPEHDSGSKMRLMVDNLGSYNANIYTTDFLDNELSYFAYAHINNLHRTLYHNTYNGELYDLKSDKNGYNLYGNLSYHKWDIDFGSYKKDADSFMGKGIRKTPSSEGGGLDAQHNYIHLSKVFSNKIKVQLAYDKLQYERKYKDVNGIRVANAPVIDNYNIIFNDDIISLIVEKTFTTLKNKLLLGGFYKYKGFHSNGLYSNSASYYHTNSVSNGLNLYSLYAEDNYDIDESLRLFASCKGDFFRYKKDVKSQNELLLRLGFIKRYMMTKWKLFYSKGYIPLAFYQIYNPENMPYKANPNLNTMQTDIYTVSFEYKKMQHFVLFDIAHIRNKEILHYNYTTTYGWENSTEKIWKNLIELKYIYTFDLYNKISADIVYGNNSKHTKDSSPFEVLVRSFNAYKKFDFYNELVYKSSYSYQDVFIKSSFDFTTAVKYHYSKDLMVGVRGENIFHDSFKQVYGGYESALPVNDQKFWLNVEYTF